MSKILPYTNPDEVLALTGVTVSEIHCDLATSLIRNWTGVDYHAQGNSVTDKVYSGDGNEWLDLGYYPIINVSSVKIDDSLVASGDYLAPAQHGQADGYLYKSTGWDLGTGNIKISFTWGYSEIPDLIKHIASQIAALLKKETQVQNIKSESIGEYSVTYVTGENNRTEVENLLGQLPKHQSITAVGQMPDTTSVDEQLLEQERLKGPSA